MKHGTEISIEESMSSSVTAGQTGPDTVQIIVLPNSPREIIKNFAMFMFQGSSIMTSLIFCAGPHFVGPLADVDKGIGANAAVHQTSFCCFFISVDND